MALRIEFQSVYCFEDVREDEDRAEWEDDRMEDFRSSSASTLESFASVSGSFFDPEDHGDHQPMPV